MKVGIIGSGGREHAICHKLSTIKKIDQLLTLTYFYLITAYILRL